MNWNPFMVVLLIVVIAGAGGFMYENNAHMAQQVQIANTAMNDSVEKLVTANAKMTEVVATATAQATKLSDKESQLSTQTANGQVCEQDKARLSNQLNQAQTSKIQAEQTAVAVSIAAQTQAATLMALQAENHSIKSQKMAETRETPTLIAGIKTERKPIPVTSVTGDLQPAVLPSLGIGLFGLVVFASYRMLKMEEQPGRRARKYSADADTVFVKMTRQNASRYGRARSKSAN